MKTGVIIPVKELRASKARLGQILSEAERRELTIVMFSEVLETLLRSELVNEVLTVSSDEEIIKLGNSLGSTTLAEVSHMGVNQAVSRGNDYYTERRIDATLVIPADVPLVTKPDLEDLIKLASDNNVVITPSRNNGTNALLRRPPTIINTFYDNNSFANHIRECDKNALKSFVFRAPSIMLDADSAEDLLEIISIGERSRTAKYLKQLSLTKRVHELRANQ